MKAVNLLPQDLRNGPRRGLAKGAAGVETVGGSGPFAVLGALALCLLAVAAYVLADNAVVERENELAQVSAEHELATSRAAALKPYGDFQALAVKRSETVSALASLRFDWEQALRDVSRALPAAVTLTALDGSISTETSAAASQLRGTIPSPAITLKGCTRSQGAVATTMSRLRGVRGVTRVSLAKSERIETDASAGSKGSPCGAGAPPQFELIVFFERSHAATAPADAAAPATANAAGGTAGSTAQPAAGTGAAQSGQAQTAPASTATQTSAP